MVNTEIAIILGGGVIAFIASLLWVWVNRKNVNNENPIMCDDAVVRSSFSFMIVFFSPIGGAELGALLVVILKNFDVLL